MEQLKAAIEEVQMRLVEIDRDLAIVGEDFNPFDGKAATAVVLKRGKLNQELEGLKLRLPILQEALKTAERTEAVDRVTSIAVELVTLAGEGEKEVSEFATLINRLQALVDAADRRRQQWRDLAGESRYLALKYEIDASPGPDLATPLPHLAALPLFARTSQAALLSQIPGAWSIKLEKLQDARRAEAQRQPRPQGRVVDHRASSAAILARQGNEPQVTHPNAMRRLLDGER